MAYGNTCLLENHPATKICHFNTDLLMGKQQIYPQVCSAPHLRPLRSSVEHAPRDHSEESTNYPETTTHSGIESPPTFIPSPPSPLLFLSLPAILSTQSDPSSPSESPIGGHPTSTISGLPQSTAPSPKISSLITTTSDVALASGQLPSGMPTATSAVTKTHVRVGIIVGSVLGGLVLLGVAVCYVCLFRKTRRRKTRYDNLQSEDERPYLLGPEGDDNWIPYPQTDDLSMHSERVPQEFGGRGHYMSLPQQSRRGNHHSYSLVDLTHSRFSSAGSRSLGRDHNGSDVRRSVGGPLPQQRDVESDSRANYLAERSSAEVTSVGAQASNRASILSWARTAFSFAEPNVLTGYCSTSSRTTVVDVDQISLPRRLQKWQRPLEPKRGAG